MLKTGRWIFTLALLCCVSWTSLAEAQLRIPFNKRTSTAPTVQDVQLQQSCGPWLIMCASFNGQRGLEQAMQLVTELRNDHRLNAYVYRHEFNHEQKVMGSGWTVPEEEIGLPKPKKWKALSDDSYEKVAVLIGDYAEVTDRKAVEDLQKVKMLMPRSMMNNPDGESEQSLEQQFRAQGRGPLSAAFLMPNPLLPAEFFSPANTIDETVQDLNKDVKYSLLKCPGQFTVRVATFTGARKFNATVNDIEQARREDAERMARKRAPAESDLADAFYKANLLCRALRKKGVEAYEFHDRNESYVCVGNFDWATRKMQDGKDFLNPDIADVISQYKASPRTVQNGMQRRTELIPRTIAAFKEYDITFDSQPMPIIVPRASARTASRRGLFRR